MNKIYMFLIPVKRYLYHNYIYYDGTPVLEVNGQYMYLYAWSDNKHIAKKFKAMRRNKIFTRKIERMSDDELSIFESNYDFLRIDKFELEGDLDRELYMTELEYDTVTGQYFEFMLDIFGEDILNSYNDMAVDVFKKKYQKAIKNSGIMHLCNNITSGDDDPSYYNYFDLTKIFLSMFDEVL